MASSPNHGPSPPAILDFDPSNVLDRDPYVLLDPRLLAPLLTQFAEELGPERASITVMRIGALLGLRDAHDAVARAGHRRAHVDRPIATPLRMRCQQRRGADGQLEIHGQWPDRHEAAARLAAVGASPAGGCQLSLGYTSGWLSGLFELDLCAFEKACGVDGHPSCSFVARTGDAWHAHASPEQQQLIEALGLPELRDYLADHHAGRHRAPRLDEADVHHTVDRDACAIHVWGPVMVIPYAGPDEALSALELIGRDPAAAEVTVVVVDLEEAMLDEAHGALALEHIVHCIEAWGAEAIFTEPSPLSARVVLDLENSPLLVVKDLDEAISTAFQVAESQRHDT